MKRALASGLVRRKRSTQTRVSSHRTGTSRNWEATVYAVFIQATGDGNNNYTNLAIAERSQSESCCSLSSLSVASGFRAAVRFLFLPCPRSCHTETIPESRDGLYSSGLPCICFKLNLTKVVLGQTEGSRPYALDITFTVRETFSGPWPRLLPRMSTAIEVPVSITRSRLRIWHR